MILMWMENMTCKIYSSSRENYADVKSYVKYNNHYYFLVTNCTGSWGPDYKVFYTSTLIYECYDYYPGFVSQCQYIDFLYK